MKISPATPKPLYRTTPEDELDQKLREVSRSYEKHFLSEMVKAMRASIPESELLKKGMAEKIYSEKMDEQYVESWGDSGGIGLADLIYQDVKEKILGHTDTAPETLPKVMMPMPLKEEEPPILKMKEESFEMSLPSSEDSQAVLAPMDGKVVETHQVGSRAYLRLDQGLYGTSILSFQGLPSSLRSGDVVTASQELGRVADALKPVHWKWVRNKV